MMKKIVKTRAFKDRLKGHKDAVTTLYSPEGVTSGILFSASKDGCIRVWDLVERKITIKHLLSRDPINSKIQALRNENYEQQNDDQDKQEEVCVKQDQKQDSNKQIVMDQFSCTAFGINSIFAGYEDGLIYAWSMQTGEVTNKYVGHFDKVTQLGSIDGTLRTWDPQTGQNTCVYKLKGPINIIRVNDHLVHAIEPLTEGDEQKTNAKVEPKCIIEGLNGWILCMNYLDNYLYTGGDDRKIKVWDINNNMEELAGHDDGIISIEFAGSMLYSGSFDNSIRSWDLKEMHSRIRERSQMFMEDLWSKKFNVFYDKLYGKKKKKASKKGTKK